VLLVENRDMIFYSDPKLRTIDFHITLTAAQDVIFGDTKEGAFAIRLADAFTERKGAKIVDADGRTGMVQVWGKRSNWVDYTAEVDGERLGVAMFDHPQSPRNPTYWHARDYGLFALNPFGRSAFDPKQEESVWKLPAGEKVTFLWCVVIHAGDAQTGHVADLYKEYAAGKQ
jgi:methane monooxygenase PmoA-like